MFVRKSFWLAVLAYLLPTFALGYFWHLVSFASQYHRLAMYRDEVIIPFGLASMLIQALLFAWAYPRLFGANGRQWLRGAVGFGIVFGALAWSFAVLPVAAKYRMASVQDFLMLETAFTVLQFLIVSPLIALTYRSITPRAERVATA
jgi:riboflavin transporter FmnP